MPPVSSRSSHHFPMSVRLTITGLDKATSDNSFISAKSRPLKGDDCLSLSLCGLSLPLKPHLATKSRVATGPLELSPASAASARPATPGEEACETSRKIYDKVAAASPHSVCINKLFPALSPAAPGLRCCVSHDAHYTLLEARPLSRSFLPSPRHLGVSNPESLKQAATGSLYR